MTAGDFLAEQPCRERLLRSDPFAQSFSHASLLARLDEAWGDARTDYALVGAPHGLTDAGLERWIDEGCLGLERLFK